MFCALTIDLEDWYQGVGIPAEQWSQFESRIEKSTRILLGLFRRHQAKATFFISGYIAQKNPNLIAEIESAGHEIASHGFNHCFIYRMTPAEFRADLQKSLQVLSRLVKGRIRGFRAPYFSLTHRSLWAIDEIKNCGLDYDSSIFPIRNYRYGIPGSPHHPYRIDNDVWEFPVTIGGIYFRALPYWLIRQRMRRGGVFYLHPWELDPDQPRFKLPPRIAIPHYYNLGRTEKVLARLLTDIEFITLAEYLGEVK